MAPVEKRKASPSPEVGEGSAKRRFVESEDATADGDDVSANTATETPEIDTATSAPKEGGSPAAESDRMAAYKARFDALKARNRQGQKENAKELKREQDRIKADPNFLKKLERQNAIAQQKLIKADMEAAGDDFERKRAWDWTIDESEKWDRRMEGKVKNYNRAKFTDYTEEAEKVYDRQTKNLKVDLDAYQRQQLERIQKAIDSGELQLAETEDGEVVAVDKTGSFSISKQPDFSHKPTEEALNALAADVEKSKELRLKQRAKRNKAIRNEDGEVTYINVKNQQFTQKLGRFFDKYTTELRDNFERGTAI